LKTKSPPTIPLFKAIKLLVAFRNGHIEILEAIKNEYGDIVLCGFPINRILLFHPNDIHHILVKNHKNYLKSSHYQALIPMFGKGLVTSEGELWKKTTRHHGKFF